MSFDGRARAPRAQFLLLDFGGVISITLFEPARRKRGEHSGSRRGR